MMDMIKNMIAQKGAEFAAPLVEKLGFSQSQATMFLPMAIEALMAKFGNDDKDESSSFSLAGLLGGGGDDISSMVDGIDVADIASKVGIGEDKAKSGLAALAPAVVDGLKEQGVSSVLGALGGGDGGGIGGMLGKLF